ncbi:unnamed protein product [Ectocarpus sp. CCAP 1310/34]|nr:unnamed protein product [Ectocarpus sp. CCAP 1310/34]
MVEKEETSENWLWGGCAWVGVGGERTSWIDRWHHHRQPSLLQSLPLSHSS